MKLGDNLTNPVALIDQLYANGAAAVVLFNRFYQPDINIENMEHMSGEIFSNASDLANPLRWIGIASAVVDKIDWCSQSRICSKSDSCRRFSCGSVQCNLSKHQRIHRRSQPFPLRLDGKKRIQQYHSIQRQTEY